ncbi:MAG: hypothetical protein KDC46_13125 [Thermoleophilia bacterium]|nr:hypothetical protein [Thermoleophilia bacterium]
MTSISSATSAAIQRLTLAIDATDDADPAKYPPRTVQVERGGLKTTMRIAGTVLGGGAIAGALTAFGRAATSGGRARVQMPFMLAMAGAAAVGGVLWGTSGAIPDRSESALAAGIPTRDLASRVAGRLPGRTEVVECSDGTFAVLRKKVTYSSGGGGGSSSHRSGGSSSGGYRPPSSSGGGSSYPSSGGGGSTSRGDDSGSSRNSSSNGNPSSSDF